MKGKILLVISLVLVACTSWASQLSEEEINKIREEKVSAFKKKQKEECEYWKGQEEKLHTATARSMVQKYCYGKDYIPSVKPVTEEVATACEKALERWQSDKNKENAYRTGEACFPGEMPIDIEIGGDDGEVYKYAFPND